MEVRRVLLAKFVVVADGIKEISVEAKKEEVNFDCTCYLPAYNYWLKSGLMLRGEGLTKNELYN